MTKAEIYKKQVETCKQVQDMINELYISKDKIRKEIEKTEKELYNGEILQRFAYIKIETLKDLLEE